MNQPAKKRITLRDVAEEAGVSHQTVSRVINDSPHVADPTRKRVLKAMATLGYRPNEAAQILSSGRSRILEILTPTVWGIQGSMLGAMLDVALQNDYKLIMNAEIGGDEAVLRAVANADSRLMDGILLYNPRISLSEEKLLSVPHPVPLVQVGGKPASRVATVCYDQYLGGCLAAQHVIDLAHRRIALLRGPSELYDAEARYEGWIDTLRANETDPAAEREGRFDVESGHTLTHELLDEGHSFTALIAANDNMALGAIHALDERGLRVPQDVSVVGFDDQDQASHFLPPLTTVRQEMYRLGQLAFIHLLSYLEDPDMPPYQRLLPPRLIIRKSTRRIQSRLGAHDHA